MKYADKVIDLMAPYPGRPFVMRQIVRYINPTAQAMERAAIKKAVQRVLVALSATGQISIKKAQALGGTSSYEWETGT